MIAADRPTQRPPQARLLVVDARGRIDHLPRSALVDLLRPGDHVIANDAATLPASLHGIHMPTGGRIEVRLAGRRSLAADDVSNFSAIVFGAGDFRTRTEDRPPPPRLTPGDRLALGPLSATVESLLGPPPPGTGGSSRSARPSCVRSSMPPHGMDSCMEGKALPRSAST